MRLYFFNIAKALNIKKYSHKVPMYPALATQQGAVVVKLLVSSLSTYPFATSCADQLSIADGLYQQGGLSTSAIA